MVEHTRAHATTRRTSDRSTPAERDAMRRALDAALRGPRSRNPQVGCLLLAADGAVLSEGRHRGAGTPHAEIDALAGADPARVRGATAVVTLEPCNHTGRTGPCSRALADAGVARVVFASRDPGGASAGGAEALRRAGVDVVDLAAEAEAETETADAASASGLDSASAVPTAHALAARADELIAPWAVAHALGRPHVTLKWAQSLDGRAAAADGTSQWISGPESRADVHERRAQADAIVAGTGTILADDAALTARNPDGSLRDEQPVPVVVGTRPIPATARVRSHPHEPILAVPDERGLRGVLDDLEDRGLHRVLVEGGPTLASAFLAAGLVDRILVYQAPIVLGGPRTATGDAGVATLAAAPRFAFTNVRRLGDDLLLVAEPPSPSHARSDA